MNRRDDISFLGMLLLVFVPSSPIHAKAMHQIEQALTKNSLTGAGVSILSSVLAKAKLLDAAAGVSNLRENLMDFASDVGMIVGLLIGCLTLVLKAKEFYKEIVSDGTKRKPKSAHHIEAPPANHDSEGLV